jgi:hypothetical protein
MIDVPPFNWLDLAVFLFAFAVCGTLVGLALRLVDKAIATRKLKTGIRRHPYIPSGLSSESDHANKP